MARQLLPLLCIGVLAVSALDLVGWWLHMPALVGLFAGYATMKPNTAVTAALLALTALCKRSRGRLQLLSQLLSGAAVLLTAATLLEYITGRSLGIDMLLANVPPERSGDPTGRMAVGTAIDGLLSGCGIFVLDLVPVLSTVLTALAALVSLSALIGVMFDAGPLLGVPLLRSMAVRTGACLFAMQIAAFLLRPEREPTRSLLHTVRFHRTGVWFVLGTCTLPLILGFPVASMYRHGFYDAPFALGLLVVLLIGCQALLVSRNSHSLAAIDARRDLAERERAVLADANARNYAQLERSEARAAHNEAQYRLITDALPAYIAYIDRELRYVHMNQTYLDVLGRPLAEIEGKTVDEVLGASALEIRPHLLQALAGVPQSFEAQIKTGNGERLLSISQVPEMGADGMVQGVIVQANDITARKKAELALRESEERFRVLSEYSPLGIYQADMQGSVTYVNPQVARTFGRPQETLLGNGWLRFVHSQDKERISAEWSRSLAQHSAYEQEYRVMLEDGHVRHVHGRATFLVNEAGTPSSVVGTLDDVTARKLSEQALRQTEKLAAVGRLASSIAHEINNPLEAVTNLLYLATHSESLAEVQGLLQTADSELRRVSAIASQTLRFHKQASNPVAVTAAELMESVLAIYRSRIGNARIKLEEQHRASNAVACMDGEIRQVLNNLVGNAIDAMGRSGGRLVLRSRDSVSPLYGSKGLLLTIADTGTGMSASTLHSIYEPFFTTKGMNGTGLGLWVSKEIVERHRGSLRVRSSQQANGHGTVFQLFLPCSYAGEEAADQAGAPLLM